MRIAVIGDGARGNLFASCLCRFSGNAYVLTFQNGCTHDASGDDGADDLRVGRKTQGMTLGRSI